MSKRAQAALTLAIAVSVAWAAVEARNLTNGSRGRGAVVGTPSDSAAVEASFAPLRKAWEAGRREESLLGLRDRTARGPYAGYAWFLLGEMAYEEGAYSSAVTQFRTAVETDPSVADRGSAFSSARVIAARLEAIRQGPWREQRPAEIRDLYYLQRRLAGGCE